MNIKNITASIITAISIFLTACGYSPSTPEEIAYDKTITQSISSAQKMIDFGSSKSVIRKKVEKMENKKEQLSQNANWKHYEDNYNDMIEKLKEAL